MYLPQKSDFIHKAKYKHDAFTIQKKRAKKLDLRCVVPATTKMNKLYQTKLPFPAFPFLNTPQTPFLAKMAPLVVVYCRDCGNC